MIQGKRKLIFSSFVVSALASGAAFGQGLVGLINPSADRQLAVVSPSSGAVTPLATPIAGVSLSTVSGVNSIDRAGNRLFFVGTPSAGVLSLYVIDTVSGVKISSPSLSNAQNGVVALAWDAGESTLFCLVSVGSGDRQLGTVNLGNGAISLLGSPINGAGLSTSGGFALDASGNRFFFVGTPNGGNPSIYAINTSTGGKISSHELNGSAVGVSALAWDSTSSTLYALYSISGGDRQIGTLDVSNGDETLYGNPIAGKSLSTNAATLDAEGERYLFVGTPLGDNQAIYSISTINGIEIDSPDLSNQSLTVMALEFDSGPLFADGFASHDTSAWSLTVP